MIAKSYPFRHIQYRSNTVDQSSGKLAGGFQSAESSFPED
jgi:hypothetical protein